jgi:hypothetical protein
VHAQTPRRTGAGGQNSLDLRKIPSVHAHGHAFKDKGVTDRADGISLQAPFEISDQTASRIGYDPHHQFLGIITEAPQIPQG